MNATFPSKRSFPPKNLKKHSYQIESIEIKQIALKMRSQLKFWPGSGHLSDFDAHFLKVG